MAVVIIPFGRNKKAFRDCWLLILCAETIENNKNKYAKQNGQIATGGWLYILSKGKRVRMAVVDVVVITFGGNKK